MAPNSPACSFIHASMAGSRSTAPLNRSGSVLIVAPLSRPMLTYNLHRQGRGLVVSAGTKEIYFLSNAVAVTDSERLVGKPYLGITSGLPVIRSQSRSAASQMPTSRKVDEISLGRFAR